MRFNQINSTLKTAVSAASVFLLGTGLALAQQQVNLTAGPTSITLPDGSNVPMWGYTCTGVTGTAGTGGPQTCKAANASAGAGSWSPVVITVPTGQDLAINLTNMLPSPVPTSIMIVGQVGGGLGGGGTPVNSPQHPTQQVTWPTANTGQVWTPPAQGQRVQSFGTEVAAGSASGSPLLWKAPRPGTYLLESGTHPSIQGPMGLYGILVVTSAPTSSAGTETAAGQAYPNVSYDADVPLILSEIDPAQNNAVYAAVTTAGFSETASRGPSVSGAVLSATVTNGGSGYSSAPTVTFSGTGGATATATIDTGAVCTGNNVPGGCSPTAGQVTGITITGGGMAYTSAPTIILTGGGGSGAAALSDLARSSNSASICTNTDGSPAGACYPPAVNYTPLYYMINGVAFNRTSASASLFPVAPLTLAPASGTGSVLVRFVNAGVHMHVPTIVGSLTQQLATGTAATVGGFELIAEDGNPLPGIPRVQSEVFMAAGKTYDVLINAPAACTPVAPATTCTGVALPVYDRELSLSGNAINRDAGMLAYLSINGSGLPSVASLGAATAYPDTYNSVIPGSPLTISDPAKGVIANDVNVLGVQVSAAPTQGTLTLNANGTFTYVPIAGWTGPDTFGYCGNGATSGAACTTVTLGAAPIETATGITLTCPAPNYTSKEATYIKVPPPGVLSCIKDALGYPVTVDLSNVTPAGGLSLNMDANGGFSASVTGSGPTTSTFTFQVKNAQGTVASNPTGAATATPLVTATLTFPAGSGLSVSVVDGKSRAPVTDYRWIIEEDRSFYISPNCTSNPPPAGCIQTASGTVPLLGTNFHTSDMPYVAQGCTGPLSCEHGQTQLGQPVVCDVGNGNCRPDTGTGKTAVDPSQVVLDPSKRYYISVLPGDAAQPFISGNSSPDCSNGVPGATNCGHGMGGAPIPVACTPTAGQTTCTAMTPPAVTVLVEADPYPPADLAVNVFEDDFPLNGEQDSGGGIDVLATNEPGLGGFNILLWDDMGGSGDVTGQMTYDMFNQPLSNSLDGYIDPATNLNACQITQQGSTNPTGITGMIVTCPKYESDGKTLSPLAGEAVIKNLMPGRFSVQAIPAADRIAKGEEWLQTNTLDGQKAHDSFLRIGEPDYFQEFGPANYHVNIGFANPKIINSRLTAVCQGTDPNAPNPGQHYACTSSVSGKVTTERMSRTPDERLYSSGSRDSFYFTQCYVSVGDPDGEDFAFTKCNSDGTFTLSGLPEGNWRLTTFDQWNDQLVDGLSFPIPLTAGTTFNFGDVPANQWQANVYTRTFIDDNKDGISQSNEGGIPFINTTVRYRDGSMSNNLVTDLTGTANFNEEFPLFNWYVVETDTTRYKTTGIHTVYDAGGPADGTPACGQNSPGYPLCGTGSSGTDPYNFLANTAELTPLPADLSVPGAVYCSHADCGGLRIQTDVDAATPSNPATETPVPSGPGVSTGRIDPPWLGGTEGWQGYSGENNFIEFGKAPYTPGENGGIKGHVIYASTRPFDDPQMLVQTQWEPLVPHVTINLYQEGTAADGITPTLTLVDSTQTSSFDDFAQGFRTDASGNPIMVGGHYVPNMNCPGQTTTDPFYFSLENQPDYLDFYNNVEHAGGTGSTTPLPYNSQYKCYDGMHNWNQLQPVPYDGMYSFPSVSSRDANGKPTGTNCSACTTDPATDEYNGIPMLKPGKYVVEVVPPEGYEIVKEEDKNILIGDNFIAPVTQEFGGLGDIFIIPDQAQVGSAYNPNNAQNSTESLGASPNNGIVPGFTPEPTWPCVGESRIVPDYISLFPQSQQVAPFAGATRNLCDRKEVTLTDQAGAIAKFYLYTSTHKAAKFTGVITDDFTSEFDPFSPQFGEKFAPANMPIAIKDWTGSEIARVYSDWWGDYDGLTYSTWEVNPPNPTGYSPTMMIFCMNDKGTGTTPDPLFNPGYSQFCYELPYMPGQTQYLDTPVVPTSAFSAGYNHPDCSYPAATPAIKEVDGDGVGPYVAQAGNTLTITALGDQQVINNAYSGPQAHAAPFNSQYVTRHYGFGGTQGTGTVTIGGVPATVTSWSDSSITVTVPSGVPACAVQQQAMYGGSLASCGQLVVTAGSGQQSIDTVTVTIGGKKPTFVSGTTPLSPTGTGSIQAAIDAAQPGDLIIVPPGNYQEMLLMWKPVRLQGVGAATSIIDANAQPAGKMDPWRKQLGCLFGLAPNGTPLTSGSCAGSAWNGFNAVPNNPQVDRLPLEGIVGWDTTTNGNLAQLLSEPTLMGAYEGAAITVIGKGVNPGPGDYFGVANEATFPTGSTNLTSANCDGTYPSNFQCNPSSIDGLTLTDSSEGGGGIFVHAWAHNLQIANNRVYGNIGTLSGGINVGQGESPDAYLNGTTLDTDPGSCEGTGQLVGASDPVNTQEPYCFDLNVNVHNNSVTSNTSIGDELFSGTPAGAGGVSFCTGADYYKFNYNWVCGNMSTGDGGGVAHIGFNKNGDIEHNTIIFNQSLNPTIPTNGGGLIVMATAPDGTLPGAAAGTECGSVTDVDCAPGLGDGTGPGLVINANLILGNGAEAGSGGGLRLQGVNGTDIPRFPSTPANWYSVQVTNNIITNNVAGWDGGGVSLQDALAVNLINNTIASNDSTATAGVLFNTLGAPLASAPGATNQTTSPETSAPQPAGVVTMANSTNLTSALPGGINSDYGLTCPANHPNCGWFSNPYLANDLIWQNRSYYVGVGGAVQAAVQQNLITMFNASFSGATTGAPLMNQTATGQCVTNSSYWDIGVRGDSGPGNHGTTIHGTALVVAPTYSLLTNPSETPASQHDINASPSFASQYCNGSRVPPEFTGGTFNVPPGISDATVPNPIFNLTPSATVDEGNNWVNMTWGPLSLTAPSVTGSGAILGNYAMVPGSPAIDYVPSSSPTFSIAPTTDFYGKPRPDTSVPNSFDIGAIEYQGSATSLPYVSPASLDFGTVGIGGTGPSQTLTLTNPTPTALTYTVAVTTPYSQPSGASGGTCGASGILAHGSSCSISVVFSPTAAGSPAGTVAITGSAAVVGSPVALTGTGAGATVTLSPIALSFPNQRPGTTSPVQTVTVANTGGLALSGGNYTFTAGSGFSAAAGGTCGTTLAVGATCNINVVYSPTATTTNSDTLTVTYTGATVTPSGVALTGTDVVPTLTSIAPVSGAQGTTVPVTLTGTDLTNATTVTMSGAGITCTAVGASTATSITASCAIASNATLTARDVTAATFNGSTNTLGAAFNVIPPPPPTLTTVAPNNGLRGTTVGVILTGSNFTNTGTTVTVSGAGVTVSNVVVINQSSATASFTIASGTAAPLTARNVTVTTPGGTKTLNNAFTVVGPTLTSVVPPTIVRNSPAESVVLTGTALTGATAITVSGANVSCTITGTPSATTVNANCVALAAAATGNRTIAVVTPIGTTNTETFAVALPSLASIAPATGVRGSNVPVTLTGVGLTNATAVTVSGTGVAVVGVTPVNDTTVTAQFNIAGTATANARTVTVTSPGGTTGNVEFTITMPPAPILSSILPTTGERGTIVPVILTGTNLSEASAVTFNGSGTTCVITGTPTSTSVSANCTISAASTLGARTVTVTTPGGTSNTVAFTVTGPALLSIAPIAGARGKVVPVTLTGTDLTGATAVTISGTGVTASLVSATNDTTVTATFTITTGATLSARGVTITTPNGITPANPVLFTVLGPTLTGISPGTGTRGTTVPVTLTGNYLDNATGATVSGTNITCSTPVVSGGTNGVGETAATNCTIAVGATLGARTVTVTTPIGTTGTEAFTVTGATVTIPAPVPVLTTSPANRNQKTGTITVANAATATAPLTITTAPMIVNGVATLPAVTITGGTCTSGFVVNPGSSCTIFVQYTPPAAPATNGTQNANVTVTGTGMATLNMSSANFNAN